MASERKREKRKIRKQKKRMEYLLKKEEELKSKKIQLDIINILKEERYDTKPNMAKFLKQYVKNIRIFNCNNIEVYPTFHYEISRVFIKFINDAELMMIHRNNTTELLLIYDLEDAVLKPSEKELISQFFDLLFEFKFIH